jgi:hypothetical protein
VYFTFAFGVGAFWAFAIGSIVASFGYAVAFGVMAASYVGAAVLLIAIRDTGERGPTWYSPVD